MHLTQNKKIKHDIGLTMILENFVKYLKKYKILHINLSNLLKYQN